MIYVFLANGFEECEALAPIDILRRAKYEVITVGVNGKTAFGSHNIPVVCDITISEAGFDDIEAIILPGGMPGTLNLENNQTVQSFIDYAIDNDLLIGAICAAPSILGHKGLLNGKKTSCFPGFEKDLIGANFTNSSVIQDGNIITAKGAGVAFEFGFKLLSYLEDEETANELKKQMMYI